MLETRLSVSKIKTIHTFADCIDALSIGNPVLLWEQQSQGIALGLSKWDKRSIEEPTVESGVRGSREGFTETVGVNTSRLRRIIKTPALKMQSFKIGSLTQTEVVIAYIEGIADQTLIDEVRNRLQRIEIDGILESGYIEEMLEDCPYSPFPQLLSTERPDVACSSLLEGRVIILVNGTPNALVAPTTLFSLLQSHEDYYTRSIASSLTRWMRYVFTIFFLLPSFYIAILTFHQEMVPTNLLLSMSASREGVLFPAIIETLIMELTFEVLREAGIRLPKQFGAAVSIVGALVIGQAAVQAGIVSAPMIIVVAITGIASFMAPRYIAGIAFRMIRFPIMILAASLGIPGIIPGVIVIIIHLCSLRSFGVPYLSPLAPFEMREMK